jgi:CheY-like chemotaxis protein
LIEAVPLLHDTERSRTAYFAGLLRRFYDDLLDRGIPEDLAGLVRQLQAPGAHERADTRKLALVIEQDAHLRSLAGALLEETDLVVVECDSADAALRVLEERGAQVAFIFADEETAGAGRTDLAQLVGERWPGAHVVITTDAERAGFADLAPAIVTLTKPWRGLDVLMAAERALLHKAQERQAG